VEYRYSYDPINRLAGNRTNGSALYEVAGNTTNLIAFSMI
jgi:hypothetical protein